MLKANGMVSVFTTVPAPSIGTVSDYYLPIPGDFDRDGHTDIFFYNSDSLAPSIYLKTTGNVTFAINEVFYKSAPTCSFGQVHPPSEGRRTLPMGAGPGQP